MSSINTLLKPHEGIPGWLIHGKAGAIVSSLDTTLVRRLAGTLATNPPISIRPTQVNCRNPLESNLLGNVTIHPPGSLRGMHCVARGVGGGGNAMHFGFRGESATTGRRRRGGTSFVMVFTAAIHRSASRPGRSSRSGGSLPALCPCRRRSTRRTAGSLSSTGPSGISRSRRGTAATPWHPA